MDFSFTEEQTLLRNSIEGYLNDNYDFDARRKIVESDEGMSRDNWAQFAELGLFGAAFTEEEGGFATGPLETMIIMEEFGKKLVVEPFFQTCVLGGGFLRHGGSDAQKETLIPQIIDGSLILSFAFAEPQGRYNLANLTTTAKKDGDDFVINGYKAVAVAAPWADKLIVTARTSGDQMDKNGVTVFIVDKNADGITTRDYPTVDGQRASEVTFDNVRVSADNVIGEVDKGLPLVERVVDEGIAALCAEATGAMGVSTNLTVEYSKERKQFGQPIGKFQVLQHRMVDMFMNHQESVSMMYLAYLNLNEGDAERVKAVSGAKALLSRTMRLIGQDSIQIHGGMGMTDEMAVGHYFKRLTMIENMFGNGDFHKKRYAAA